MRVTTRSSGELLEAVAACAGTLNAVRTGSRHQKTATTRVDGVGTLRKDPSIPNTSATDNK